MENRTTEDDYLDKQYEQWSQDQLKDTTSVNQDAPQSNNLLNNKTTSVKFFNEGPSEVVIPEQRYMSCRRCVYLKYDLYKSGLNPVYKNMCRNPDLHPHREVGGLHTEPPLTPEWCPFLIANKKEDE